ncbi:LacI family DNA-binding transcriptional regulator [Brucella sp. NBRC 12950]|jgi:DNA-binding LacI/PurR family transcriptional regulator|uniref:LacI family DNA-binding transcriptional regulator n=1 Tax=Brucella sp. NBRC 12950 TaxID=2994518 RepID=UPI0024A3BFE6|nr:LacI family DNA-binding transcriptional regulator [Brucella sp. NBRC 12950]GLU29219.1 LacI family transcriptional regulator [Brucella sp. NBRC 12950]
MADDSKKIRTFEVAALAKASPSTVSRALAGDPRISEATRERVLAAARQLNYQPNLIARGLKNSSTGIVGVVVTDLDNLYHSHTLKLLIDEMGHQRLAPLVFACNTDDRAGAVIDRLTSYQVDAVIALAAPFDAEIVQSCSHSGKPLVLMNSYDGPVPVHTVAGDSRAGGAIAAEHLVERGGKRFAFFGGEDSTRISRERELGFRETLEHLGHRCDVHASTRYTYDDGRRVAAELLAQKPDAIFCANDVLAFALMDTARQELGLSIPNDLIVVGYDNTAIASWPSFNLTSIDQCLEAMVSSTIAATRAIIDEPSREPVAATIAPRLTPRNSTAARSWS